MASDLELHYMADFIAANNLGPAAVSGPLPLITYFGPVDVDGLRAKAENGQHLRAACLALAMGIPFKQFSGRVLNLHSQAKSAAQKWNDYGVLQWGAWRDDWNGHWLHQSHGTPGRISVGGMPDGQRFFENFGRHILLAPGFRAGLVKSCSAAARRRLGSSEDASFIEALAGAARQAGGRGIVYGSRASTWVPLQGVARGLPCQSIDALVARRMSQPDYAYGQDRLPAWRDYLDATQETIEDYESRDESGLDFLAPGLNNRFAADAVFSEARAQRLPELARGENDVAIPAGEDPNWYAVTIG